MKLNLSKRGLALLLIASTLLSAKADLPFRNHRYDSFKAVPVNEKSIVFYGNSITNMNEWWECFGDNHKILNRGNSGGYSKELLDNVETLIAGHPAKVFIKIGTNDLGTQGVDNPELVASNIRSIIERFKEESPKTKVYIQSILPSTNGRRTLEKTTATNSLLRDVCSETGATYVDLYDSMMGIVSGELSYDKLHLTAKGYKVWTDIIAPLVGVPASYPAEFEENNSGMKYSYGMRSTSWGAQRVRPQDVLFIGDEMVHGGEWHELLNSSDVKNRGINWGYGGLPLAQWNKNIEAILHTNPQLKSAPRMIILNIGVYEANGNDYLPTVLNNYKKVIEKIRKYAPASKTRIVITSQLPRLSAAHNAERVQPMNEMLKALAEETENAQYLDLYSVLVDENNSANPELMKQDYVYAKGYNKIAQVLAPVVGRGAKALSDKEFDANYAYIQARTELGKAVETAKSALKVGGDSGKMAFLQKELETAYKLLRKKNEKPEVLTAAAQNLLAAAQ